MEVVQVSDGDIWSVSMPACRMSLNSVDEIVHQTVPEFSFGNLTHVAKSFFRGDAAKSLNCS